MTTMRTVGVVALGMTLSALIGGGGVVGSGDMDGFASWLEDLGVPMPAVQARMAMISELAGGALLAVGLATRPACLALIFTMLVAGIVGAGGNLGAVAAGFLFRSSTFDYASAFTTMAGAIFVVAVAVSFVRFSSAEERAEKLRAVGD